MACSVLSWQPDNPSGSMAESMLKRTPFVYLALAGIGLFVLIWQIAEHRRVRSSLEAALIHRARDMGNSLSVVMRSQRRFGGRIFKQRLESALGELVKSEEMRGAALLNESLEVVASAGAATSVAPDQIPRQGTRWEPGQLTLVNLVDLGPSLPNATNAPPPTIVVDEEARPERDDPQRREEALRRLEEFRRRLEEGVTNTAPDGVEAEEGASRRRPIRIGRPPWMTQEEYDQMVSKQGVHGFLVVLSTSGMTSAILRDAWLRCLIVILNGLSVSAAAFAWRTLTKSSEVELRLIQARAQNTHLREMNLAAAGLAHETRNPLNLIRGVATMIAKQDEVSDKVRGQCRDIAEEVDRVTAQLNEFINFSKPRDLRRTPVLAIQLAEEVRRTLQAELEDQQVVLELRPFEASIEADEKMLRQVLFNLIINAIEALEQGGRIEVEMGGEGPRETWLEVRDDGPGVDPEVAEKVFQPYCTTRTTGTGLGLALVKQIALAHGWEVSYRPNTPRGACFRIGKIKLAGTK